MTTLFQARSNRADARRPAGPRRDAEGQAGTLGSVGKNLLFLR
jgi:hypothetical protein